MNAVGVGLADSHPVHRSGPVNNDESSVWENKSFEVKRAINIVSSTPQKLSKRVN